MMHRALTRRAQKLDDLEYQLRQSQQTALRAQGRGLAEIARRLQACDLRLRLARRRQQENAFHQRIRTAMQTRLWQERRRFESLELHLRQLSPLTVLGRGYAIAETLDGRILRSPADTVVEEQIRVRLHRGTIGATVTATGDVQDER